MLSKCAASLSKKIINSINLRFTRQLQTSVCSKLDGSYLHNPGSEPLTIATLGEAIAETAHKYPDRIAIRSIHEDISMTYEELLNKVDSIGCALRDNGFEKGDRIGIWVHNSSGWVTSVLAAARAGLIAVFMNPTYEKDELQFCINKTQIKGLVIGDNIKNIDYYGLLNKILPELQFSKEGFLQSENCPSLRSIITAGKKKLGGVTTLDSLINNYKNNSAITQFSNQVKPEDGVHILMTSGTTGKPKGALLSHIAVLNNSYLFWKRLGLQEQQQVVCLQSPLFHALGSLLTLLGPLRHGSTVVLPSPMYSTTASLNALCAEKCTVITGTPTMYVDIISRLKSDMPLSLRLAITSGASCSHNLINKMNDRLKANPLQVYGLTELSGAVFQTLPNDSMEKIAESVGYISDNIEVKVVDTNGNIVPYGTAGELMVRGYGNLLQYWDDPEKTQMALEDGWFHTGDEFTISDEGYGTILSRIKDIIVRGGENIAPKEVEDFLQTHPDIVECQVIGVSDERLGEELCAIVRVRENAQISLQNIKNYCSGKIAKNKNPKLLKVVEKYPTTSSGKILKYKLKELVESGNL